MRILEVGRGRLSLELARSVNSSTRDSGGTKPGHYLTHTADVGCLLSLSSGARELEGRGKGDPLQG